MSHYLPTDLRDHNGVIWGKESRAVLATEPAKGCVLFVHGFNGNAVGTWLEFPRLLPLETECDAYDALFFGYDGLRDTVAYSANTLGGLLESVLTLPSVGVVNPSMPTGATKRPRTFQYERVVICAHSLGAVVVRRALLDALAQKASWTGRFADVQLLFFAPAHMGARIIKLVEEGLTAFSLSLAVAKISGKSAAVGLKAKYQVLQDLEIGSQTLDDLRADTRRLLDANPAGYDFLRAHVVHAKRDNIVEHGQFVNDFKPKFIPKKNHSQVCKPELGFLEPLETLLEHV